MSDLIKKELSWLKEMMSKHRKNIYFYIWSALFIYVFKKIWKIYVLFFVILSLYSLLTLFYKKPKITIRNKSKFSIFLGYYRINTLSSFKNRKIDLDIFLLVFMKYLFRFFLGISFKIVRINIVLFDCLYEEYHWSNIKKKKIKMDIYKKFISISFEKFIFLEFIKNKPILEKEMTFLILNKKIIIEIIII